MKQRRPQALILDDSPVLARHLQLLLGRLGIGAEVRAELPAEVPATAAQALVQDEMPDEFDVIFIEVLQACGNGFQLLRELARTRACPLVLLTGTGRASDRHWGLQAGAAAVLRRPVEEAALRACLQELGLQGRSAASLQQDEAG
jgi:CheY-like chemotaxis protein